MEPVEETRVDSIRSCVMIAGGRPRPCRNQIVRSSTESVGEYQTQCDSAKPVTNGHNHVAKL